MVREYVGWFEIGRSLDEAFPQWEADGLLMLSEDNTIVKTGKKLRQFWHNSKKKCRKIRMVVTLEEIE